MLPLHCFLMREYAIRCRILPAIISSILHFLMAYFYLQKMLRWCSFDYPTTSYCSGSCKKIVFWLFLLLFCASSKKSALQISTKNSAQFSCLRSLKNITPLLLLVHRCATLLSLKDRMQLRSQKKQTFLLIFMRMERQNFASKPSKSSIFMLGSSFLFLRCSIFLMQCMVRGCFNIHQGNNEKEGESTCLHDKICSN